MPCPMYIDFTRECIKVIKGIPENTLPLCITDRHKECPFFVALTGSGYACKYLKKCPAYEHFKYDNFEDFIKIANGYCLSKENNKNCQRFKMRSKGTIPPSNLLPDGTLFHKKGE